MTRRRGGRARRGSFTRAFTVAIAGLLSAGTGCGEGFVGEGQSLGDPANYPGFACAALAQHLSRGLNGKDPA